MDRDLVAGLAGVRTIRITTTGRRSGRPVHTEIWWFHFEDRFVITGTPGPRDWLANAQADPRIVVHVLGQDLHATTVPVTDQAFRSRFFAQSDPEVHWYTEQAELSDLVSSAPMIEVLFGEA
jgi:deazaflavin-dependent oxidoreductase (nitroreductase family)